ncbi:MAG: tRNA dihydrouridine(20/20a) synthase DusA [Aestuariivirga sp.]
MIKKEKIFSIAPMMDWTDRHCRFFHRRLTRHALLYTEMVTAQAVRHGDRGRLLGLDPREQPVALQLGGHNSALLAEAARIGEGFGYCEINLNVGCPSARVQEGRFGACLMAEPELVRDCVGTMKAAVRLPVTVKCRIGIDGQDGEEDLENFIATVAQSGAVTFIIHARKAWLKGLSPKENREVPPLNHARVHALKRRHPELTIILNGGLTNLDEAEAQLRHVDGVMLGRAAYQNPWLLHDVDRRFFGDGESAENPETIVERMKPYIAEQLAKGTRLQQITRHMLGLFHGLPGARHWRRILSQEAVGPGAGLKVIDRALDEVLRRAPSSLLAAE